ncbi:sodium:proton antiporter [Thaumasiovibrio subtropicus]|uniref:sodium:proton antiporter n=1 Tax=Thaumasiovibrio subtropicus TaxID=1891207 RepID=UPI000B35E870|nr:sodium:proton antiporter [Thaumasiovibrio subtropicus]
MKKVMLYSALLMLGLVCSQIFPMLFAGYTSLQPLIMMLTMIALSYIMINVGREFELDKSNLKQYGWDYVVAMTTATFPWIAVVLYFVFVVMPPELWSNLDAWKESLVIGRFAAPTSAGVLFSMLAAAGLGATWMFKKARVLAIFDDLDTVLLMIPLSIVIVGWNPALGVALILMFGMLLLAYKYLHAWDLPASAKHIMIYSTIIAVACKAFYIMTGAHFEVLLPAFVLGCMLKSQHETALDQRFSTVLAAIFMVLVGLSLPQIFGATGSPEVTESVTGSLPPMPMGEVLFHVMIITIISNVGKMFPLCCYRNVATVKERLALCIGMWPRGEVGAGVLMISIGYGFGGPIVTIGMLSLALNLILTGWFITLARNLIVSSAEEVQNEKVRA